MNGYTILGFIVGAVTVLACQVFAALVLGKETSVTCQQCGEAIAEHPQGWRCKKCKATEDFCAGGES